ncbi:MAG: hypothetical protein EOP80_11875 [Variovorax sp.]|nr:MAG: hypothetical protein EOP80_11875 [Variovorax sp.]
MLNVRLFLPMLACLPAGMALAQPLPVDQFPVAAMSFLNAEMPQMEAAVAARDRDYFEAAMGRTLDFSDGWGFKTRANPALARYAACTEALSDFTIVGLCRLMPKADGCEPGLAPRFDANLKRCRDLAAGRP